MSKKKGNQDNTGKQPDFYPAYSKYMREENIKKGVGESVAKIKEAIEKVLKYSIASKSGLEFQGLREYQASDDAGLIDWKVSARMNPSAKLEKLYVKLYEEELDYNVFILLDTSSSMMYGTRGMYKMLYAARLTLILMMAANNAMAFTGMAMFNDKIRYLLRIGAGEDQIGSTIRELSNIKNYGGSCNFGQALKTTGGTLNENTLYIVITDSIDFDKDWKEGFKAICGKLARVGVIIIRDPIDNKFPKNLGSFRLFDTNSSKKIETNLDRVRDKYEKKNKKHLADIIEFSMTLGAVIRYYETTDDLGNTIIDYLNTMLR